MALAADLYTTHNLKASDPHTIQVNAGGTTYIPIPKGTTVNFAGLLSVQLPAGVKKGEEYEVVVRQVTSGDYGPYSDPAGAKRAQNEHGRKWRRLQANTPGATPSGSSS